MKAIKNFLNHFLSGRKNVSFELKEKDESIFNDTVVDTSLFLNSLVHDYEKYLNAEDLVFFSEIKAYGAFKYNVIKDILENREEIGVSDVHLALNNIYFTKDENKHHHNKKTAVKTLDFLSKKMRDEPNEYTQFLFEKLKANFPVNQEFDLVNYLIEPLVMLNTFHEFGFIEAFPQFDPKHPDFNIQTALDEINGFFSDTDKLEFLLQDYFDNGGQVPEGMQTMLNQLEVEVDIQPNLSKYFRSMLFSATESTTCFMSSLYYRLLKDRPDLLNNQSKHEELEAFAEEVLRIDTPVPFVYRTVRKDISIGEYKLKEGEMVVLYIGSANLDPTVFENPKKIIYNRKMPHLSFGRGNYACIGRFASHRITMNVLSYIETIALKLELTDKNAQHYIHNSMYKLPVKVLYYGD